MLTTTVLLQSALPENLYYINNSLKKVLYILDIDTTNKLCTQMFVDLNIDN